jgi:hypothetical protein
MQRIYLCLFVVFQLFWLPVSSTNFHREAKAAIECLGSLSLASPATPQPGIGTPGVQAPVILSPLPGQALQGSVPIVARTAVEGFVAFELSFGYFNNPTDVWFLIDQGNQPVMDVALAQWDTSTITDGIYTLRLVVILNDGSQQSTTVPGVRVRNYTPIETDTPNPVMLTETKLSNLGSTGTPSATSTPVPPTATPFPPNPAELNQNQVYGGVLKGGLAVLGFFALGILYQSIRSFIRNRSAL